ncbi:hypothetical protein SBRCBS47491_005976 [Sporothrix bragantina]|uniref:Uncharacterized protein n=1 Tax=Sporothrix bragantina TaxID=671064 RepID=A0ABP0C164_9PEZI
MNGGPYDMPSRGRGGPEAQQVTRDGAGKAGRGAARTPGANNGVPYGNNTNNMGGNVYDQNRGRHPGIPPERTKCRDSNCDRRIAWRNVDMNGNIFGHVQSSNSNNMGQPLPFHHNQEEREIQMKLLDILNETGLHQEDIVLLGSKPLAFGTLPTVSSSNGAIRGVPSNTGMEAPQQRSIAWLCAQFDAERDKREWLFHNRSSQVNRVPSAHCEEHTCRFFFTKELCHFKKPSYDTVCNKHAICPAFRCREGKGQFLDPSHSNKDSCQFQRHEFCSNHLCQVTGCELLCDETTLGQMGNYCPKHKCHYAGCVKVAQDHLGYCAKHKCQSEHGCRRIAAAGYKLCKNHLECSQQGCTRPRFIVPKGRTIDDKDHTECGIGVYDREPYLAYCEEHGVCADKTCSKLRIKTTVHCRKHACLERGCRNPCPEKLKYCNLHRCEMESCMSPKGWKQDNKTREAFCFNHECDFEGCVAIVAEYGACIEHLKIRHTKQAKATVHREAQQMAKTFQAARGAGGHGNAGMFYTQPPASPMYNPFNSTYYHSPAHSLSSRSASPPEWQDHDQDHSRSRDRARGRGRDHHDRGHGHNGRKGSRQDSGVHTPTSSDGGRSRYHGEDSDMSPSRVPQQRKSAPAQATTQVQRNGVAQQAQQQQARPQQPPAVVKSTPQGMNRPVGNGIGNGISHGKNNNTAEGNALNYVFLGKTVPANNNMNAGHNPPIILQDQPMYQNDEYSDGEDNWVR